MHILTSFTAYFALFHQGGFVFVSKNIFLVTMVLRCDLLLRNYPTRALLTITITRMDSVVNLEH